MSRSLTGVLVAWLCLSAPLAAQEARIAVASNFLAPAQVLAERLQARSDHRVVLLSGSTGRHYAQIIHGAPFDALLAADAERPERLEREGHIIPGSRFTYAVGRLALWSRDPALVDTEGAVLGKGSFRRLAIANPELAPYGRAAIEVLDLLGVRDAMEARLVRGENIAQAYQFAATGNAELGLVALSQLRGPGAKPSGSTWVVPSRLHAPIEQQAVLLREVPAARAYLEFLREPDSITLLREFGYDDDQ